MREVMRSDREEHLPVAHAKLIACRRTRAHRVAAPDSLEDVCAHAVRRRETFPCAVGREQHEIAGSADEVLRETP